jgi:hypothetical protein
MIPVIAEGAGTDPAAFVAVTITLTVRLSSPSSVKVGLLAPTDGYPAGTSRTRVPQFLSPSAVWLDFGGMYSVASQTEARAGSFTAQE